MSVGLLPISQYPEITPPTIQVKASCPGANAAVVAETVAAPIEQEVIAVEDTVGPQTILRYNLYPTASITGEAAPGFSSGQALALMEQLAGQKLPTSMGFEWTGMSFQEKQVGSEAIMVFALAIILVFLVLSAQYESWTSPAAVIMVVPLAVLGTVLAVMMKGADNNVYTQIGITLLIGLASKNAILIVEFAMVERERGKSLLEAAVAAAKLRFRPILMTSIASIAGIMPLVVASGAGAASQQAIGLAVVGGMVAATVMSLTFTPVFYVVMKHLGDKKRQTTCKWACGCRLTALECGFAPSDCRRAGHLKDSL